MRRISQIKVVIPLMQFWNAVGEFRPRGVGACRSPGAADYGSAGRARSGAGNGEGADCGTAVRSLKKIEVLLAASHVERATFRLGEIAQVI